MIAQNGTIPIADTQMPYIAFGCGKKNLIMIPGLGEGLKTVKGTAVPFAIMYHKLIKDYRVYVFSRRMVMPQGFSVRDMAEDIYQAMQQLHIKSANILGVSQGGMIAQWLALDHPQAVEKLILTVTISRQNETVQNVISAWKQMALQGDYKGIMVDTSEKSYTEAYLKIARPMYGLLGLVGKPKSMDRFLVQADACLNQDTYDKLFQISCPTLVIGGRQDKIVSPEASEEIAERIPGCQLYMYEQYGHGLYEEAKDFLKRVTAFIEEG